MKIFVSNPKKRGTRLPALHLAKCCLEFLTFVFTRNSRGVIQFEVCNIQVVDWHWKSGEVTSSNRLTFPNIASQLRHIRWQAPSFLETATETGASPLDTTIYTNEHSAFQVPKNNPYLPLRFRNKRLNRKKEERVTFLLSNTIQRLHPIPFPLKRSRGAGAVSTDI